MELHSEGSLKVSRKRLRGGLPGARSALTEHSSMLPEEMSRPRTTSPEPSATFGCCVSPSEGGDGEERTGEEANDTTHPAASTAPRCKPVEACREGLAGSLLRGLCPTGCRTQGPEPQNPKAREERQTILKDACAHTQCPTADALGRSGEGCGVLSGVLWRRV
ncbi:unnamed protein product [Arctogadus glacialis]